MEVIHDSAFWRDLSRARPAEKNDGTEYRVEKTDSGWKVSGRALTKPSHFPTEDRAMALARHLVGPKGGAITRVSNGKQVASVCPRSSPIRPAAINVTRTLENTTPLSRCRCRMKN